VVPLSPPRSGGLSGSLEDELCLEAVSDFPNAGTDTFSVSSGSECRKENMKNLKHVAAAANTGNAVAGLGGDSPPPTPAVVVGLVLGTLALVLIRKCLRGN
jgi:hypothetical protein